MTIPAIAPPESLLDFEADVCVSVTFVPVSTGDSKGTVVVGELVAVTTTTVLEVGRKAAEYPEVVVYSEE